MRVNMNDNNKQIVDEELVLGEEQKQFKDLVDEDGNELPYSNSEKVDDLKEEKNKLLGIVATEKGLIMQQPSKQFVKTLFDSRTRGFAGPLILGMITALAGIVFLGIVLK